MLEQFGVLGHLRSDKEPEIIAFAIQHWLPIRVVKTTHITPGGPWENASMARFHDKPQDACLNQELFGSLLAAQVVIEQWRVE